MCRFFTYHAYCKMNICTNLYTSITDYMRVVGFPIHGGLWALLCKSDRRKWAFIIILVGMSIYYSVVVEYFSN